jgi:hypothetical protein
MPTEEIGFVGPEHDEPRVNHLVATRLDDTEGDL